MDQFWISGRIKGENKSEKLWTKTEELFYKPQQTKQTGNLCPVVLRSPRFRLGLPLLQYGVKSNMAAADDNLSEFEKDALISNMMKEKAKITCDSAVKGW